MSEGKHCVSFDDRPQQQLGAKEKALFAAIRKNNAAKVRTLIAQGVNINCLYTPKRSFEFNLTPLHVAAFNQNADNVALLLEAGANVNAESGHLQAVEFPGETPLNWACGFRTGSIRPDLRVIRLLLDHGANPNHRMTDRRTSVFEASIYKGRIEIIKLQIAKGAMVNPDVAGVDSPLMIAADRSDGEIAEELLRWEAQINYQSASGKTALMKAAASGAVGVVQLLLEHAIDLNRTDENGQTAVALAATRCGDLYVREENEKKYFPIVKLLVEAGANLNVVDVYGMTALNWAERNPHRDRPDFAKNFFSDCSRYLVEKGAKRGTEIR